jgi:uncharacterized RDD family membrane protein YckC
MIQKEFPPTPENLGPASLLRRFAAMTYDALLTIAMLMAMTGAYMAASASILGAEHYRAKSEAGTTIGDPALSLILFITLYAFFGYFWTRNGQTLGMQVWHIRVQNNNNTSISWMQALLRLMVSIVSLMTFGLGYIWVLLDKKKRSWHCMLSKTEVIRIAKNK